MPDGGKPLRKLGSLTIVRFDDADPGPGHEQTLSMIERAETLGFDSVWLRHRHLQPGISSPIAMLAAATQRTSRIELGTAVIPLGLENPLRLAEDLATVDILSGGRINPGVSVGRPMLYDHFKAKLYPESHELENFSKDRVLRLLECLRGDPVSDFEGTVGIEQFSRRVQPHSPGLADRVWYGGAIQGEYIDASRAHHPHPETARVSQGLVVIPTDSASPGQIRRYRDYAAGRIQRTKTPQGPRGVLFSPDYVGTSDELADQLYDHAGFERSDEVAFALPFTFDEEDYLQIVPAIAA